MFYVFGDLKQLTADAGTKYRNRTAGSDVEVKSIKMRWDISTYPVYNSCYIWENIPIYNLKQ